MVFKSKHDNHSQPNDETNGQTFPGSKHALLLGGNFNHARGRRRIGPSPNYLLHIHMDTDYEGRGFVRTTAPGCFELEAANKARFVR